MPVIARHEGDWTGDYLHFDAAGNLRERHRSYIITRFATSGPHDYLQANAYTWPDGRREELDFPAICHDGQLWWDTERIKGSMKEVDSRTIFSTWVLKDLSDTYLYEMTHISEDNRNRVRTWHWFVRGLLARRTCITERRVR